MVEEGWLDKTTVGAWILNIQIQNPFEGLNIIKIGIEMFHFWNGWVYS